MLFTQKFKSDPKRVLHLLHSFFGLRMTRFDEHLPDCLSDQGRTELWVFDVSAHWFHPYILDYMRHGKFYHRIHQHRDFINYGVWHNFLSFADGIYKCEQKFCRISFCNCGEQSPGRIWAVN